MKVQTLQWPKEKGQKLVILPWGKTGYGGKMAL
jgi:hypothetical protein